MAMECTQKSEVKSNIQPMALPRIVSLCANGGCCPEAEFGDDGSMTLTENGRMLAKLDMHSVERLFDELLKRGYDW